MRARTYEQAQTISHTPCIPCVLRIHTGKGSGTKALTVIGKGSIGSCNVQSPQFPQCLIGLHEMAKYVRVLRAKGVLPFFGVVALYLFLRITLQ